MVKLFPRLGNNLKKRNMKKDKKMKVKLEDIIEAMEFAGMETEYYYDIQNEKSCDAA